MQVNRSAKIMLNERTHGTEKIKSHSPLYVKSSFVCSTWGAYRSQDFINY